MDTPGASASSDGCSSEDRFQELADDFLERCRRGETPSLDTYLQAAPALADRIRRHFPSMVLLEKAASASQADIPGRVGPYRVLREVGRGGMGVVYEAEHESLRRRVALKVLPSPGDARSRARFHHEVVAAARLKHPHILPIYEAGDHRGLPYYSMQLVEGSSLHAIIREVRRLNAIELPSLEELPASSDPLTTSLAEALVTGSRSHHGEPGNALPITRPPKSRVHYVLEVARIGLEIAEALSHAHAQGVVHRDIKPSNVLIDSTGWVWITDFGLAKASELDDLTGSGEFLGTLRYMAPERFRGIGDHRSDIYALGMTLYELLTLRPAFLTNDRARLLKHICDDDVPPPQALNSDIPQGLSSIVETALAKKPEERYGDAAHLARDLRLFLERKPAVHTRSFRRVISKRYSWVAGAIAIVAGLLSVLVVRAGASDTKRLDVTVGQAPQHALAIDLDGDSRVDLLTVDGLDGTFTFLRNQGSRKFAPASFATGERPTSIAVADFDRDGHLDVATTSVGSGEVVIHDGKKKFERTTSLSLPGRPWFVAAADLNGDGRPDLAVADAVRAVQVVKNTRDSGFQAPESHDVGKVPNYVAPWDMDGDGDLDLVSTSAGASAERVAVLENSGQGSFSRPAYVRRAPPAKGVVAADLDGDGDLDLAGPSRTETGQVIAEFWLVPNGGKASFEAQTVSIGSPVESLTAVDLDQDGDLDLAVAGGSDQLAVLSNKGGLKFEPQARLKTALGPGTVLSCDLDGDKVPDLVAVASGSAAVSVFFGRRGGF